MGKNKYSIASREENKHKGLQVDTGLAHYGTSKVSVAGADEWGWGRGWQVSDRTGLNKWFEF